MNKVKGKMINMTKINVDTDIISNNLLPLAKSEMDKISNAVYYANRVHFPNGEYDWPKIVGELNDCREESNKYIRWIADINEKYVNHLVDRIDDINSISIDELKKYISVVK